MLIIKRNLRFLHFNSGFGEPEKQLVLKQRIQRINNLTPAKECHRIKHSIQFNRLHRFSLFCI